MSSEPSPSLLTKVAVAAPSFLVFVIVSAMADADLGASIAFAYGALVVAAIATWHFRHRAYYWPTLALLAVGHIALLLKWHPLIPSPAIQVAPLVIVDFAITVALLFGLESLVADRGE